jgi:putative transposase
MFLLGATRRRHANLAADRWRVQGVLHYLWRAVDQDGVVLDVVVQSRRDAGAAKRFFKRLLKGLRYVPRVLVTAKLGSTVWLNASCFLM